ncbi:hypothetical protein KFK09_028506 [Dendrobium nobile]|uniref:Uncharacterized protein n=1 Tax=Dendrobium nobile TaxID=94219 RepID=A0A8T3A3A1_DENNO|nr:hypothetical protein KFK09_028506 [Dendrobium nobile]
MAQRLMSSGKSIFRALNLNHLGGGAAEGRPFIRALAPANLKRKASNSFSAIQDTYFSTKEVFESHRVVFTIGTSIASILTAWAGYSLRQHHHSNVERRLESIEKAVSAGLNLYGLGWRGGLWFANRKFRREQLKQLGQVKSRGWQSLRSPFVRFRKNPSLNKTAELTGNTSATSVPS